MQDTLARAFATLGGLVEAPSNPHAAILSTSVGAVKPALHRGRGKLAEPELDAPRSPVPAALDEFCAAFNARDLDRLTALLLDNGADIARLRNYYYTPEIITELCAELNLPCRSNGTFRARGEA